jgi:hypothetical protein
MIVVSSEAVISVILEIKLILKGMKASELDCTCSSDVFGAKRRVH